MSPVQSISHLLLYVLLDSFLLTRALHVVSYPHTVSILHYLSLKESNTAFIQSSNMLQGALALLALHQAYMPSPTLRVGARVFPVVVKSPQRNPAMSFQQAVPRSVLRPFGLTPYVGIAVGAQLLGIIGSTSSAMLSTVLLPVLAVACTPSLIHSCGANILLLASRIQMMNDRMINDRAEVSLLRFQEALDIQPWTTQCAAAAVPTLAYQNSAAAAPELIPKMDRAAFLSQMKLQHELMARRRSCNGPAMRVSSPEVEIPTFESHAAKWEFLCQASAA